HAVTVRTVLDARAGAVELVDQLAVTVTGAQPQAVLRRAAGTLGRLADVAHLFLELLRPPPRLLDQLFLPLQQAAAEVLQLHRVHVLLVRAGLVARRQIHRRPQRDGLDAVLARLGRLDVAGAHAIGAARRGLGRGRLGGRSRTG